MGGCSLMWEGVSHSGKVCPSVGGCVPVLECVPQCGRVFSNVEGVPQCGRVFSNVEGVPQCGRVCPCMCVCEVWMSLSHVLMMDTQVH